MNLRIVYRLAMVLVISQVRATRSRVRLKSLRRPIAIFAASLTAFVLAFIVFWKIAPAISSVGEGGVALEDLTRQGLIGLPSFVIFFTILSGLLWELSYSTQFSSTDIINALPLSASEYVLGSSLSVAYSYSVIPATGLGATLALGMYFQRIDLWMMTAVFTFVGTFLGAFVIEIVRAVMSRTSSAFYRRGGRLAIAIRLVGAVLILLVFQLAFNYRVMYILLQSLMTGITVAWFIPVAWPSLAIMESYQANYVSAFALAISSIAFMGIMFWVSVKLRERYWVPIPASIRISTAPYSPGIGLLGRLGFSSAESAIFKKDFRSLTRRREMARLLAIPAIILVSMLASFTSSGGELEFMAFSLVSFSLAVAIFSLVISMISIGQEASAIWNIYSSPIAPKELVRAKLTLGLLISLGVLLVIFLVVGFLFRPSFEVLILFFFLGLSLATAETSVGLMIGSKFPDFSEIPRSRFVTFSGGFVGTVVGLIVGGIVSAPAFIYAFLGQIFPPSEYSLGVVTVLTILLGVAFSLIAHKLSVRKISELLKELPT